jgi:hypothetical protein
MTQQEKTQTEEHKMGDMQEKKSEDFESLMIRRRAKEQIKESSWSEVRVKDIQVYSGYEFADASVARTENTSIEVKGTITGERNIKKVLDNISRKNKDSYRTRLEKFTHADGSTMYNGRKYLYRKRRWIIVTVESPDGTYSEDYVITRTPKFDNKSLEDVYKNILEDIGSGGSIGSPPDSKRKYLRTDRIMNTNYTSMIAESILRIGIMGTSILTGFFGAMAVMATTGSFILGTMFMASVVFTASYIQQNMYEGWFEVAPIDWIDDLPKSAKITDSITEDMKAEGLETPRETRKNFMNTDAEVSVLEDGTLEIKTPMAEWVFESEEEGIPSAEAEMLYKSYGGINFSDSDTIPVQISEYDERVPLESNHFKSENEEWILKADGI